MLLVDFGFFIGIILYKDFAGLVKL